MAVLTNLQGGQILADPSQFDPFDTDLFEWIVDDEAPDEDTFSHENGTAFMSGYLKDRDALFDALAYFVGFSEVHGGSVTTVVDRHLPAPHPRWPFMRCTQVSIKGLKFDGQDEQAVQFETPWLPVPLYDRYRFDITFAQTGMDYKENDAVDSEWERLITIEPMDEGEVVTVDGGQYEYIATGKPWDAQPVVINGPQLKVYLQRVGLMIKSYGMPGNFIMDENSKPTQFLAAKGHVNSTTFLGHEAGTMLLQGYRIHKQTQPVATHNASQLMFGCTVEMHFTYTNPSRALLAETRRGWQLLPAADGFGLDGWYGVKNRRTEANLYPEFDMNKLLHRHDA